MALSQDETEKVIRQICEGKEYFDPDSEYFDGECQSYSFFRAEEKFYLHRIDVIVAAYYTTEEVSREYLLYYLMGQYRTSVENQGFKL